MSGGTARSALVGAGLVLALGGSCTSFSESFYAVEEGRFYRSAQPRPGQLERRIWQHGIETVLCVRSGGRGDEHYETSRRAARAAGIDFVQVPLSASRFPSQAKLRKICAVLEHGRYPMLVHCRIGADRAGLVSAIYVLQRTGDFEAARAQLAFFPYGHLPWFGMDMPERLLDMYVPHAELMRFCEWARERYAPPDRD